MARHSACRGRKKQCCPVKLLWTLPKSGLVPRSVSGPAVSFVITEEIRQPWKKKVLGPASTTPNSEILPTAWGIHVTKMKQDLVDDVYPDMMSMPLAGLMEDNVQIVTYLFRKTKTSDFFDGNIRTFEAKHPYFCPKKSDVLLFPDRYIAFSLPPSTKKVFENLLHFLHHNPRCPVFTNDFGWRIGCRIRSQGVGFMQVQPTFLLFSPLFARRSCHAFRHEDTEGNWWRGHKV